MTNRPIKFRAWDEKSKFMYSPDDNNSEMFMYFDGTVCYDGSPTKDYILMQFTGLLDKNGKEIYEGDVIQDGDEPQDYEVSFNSGSFWAEEIIPLQGGSMISLYDVRGHCEIIGNIYENKDLLK